MAQSARSAVNPQEAFIDRFADIAIAVSEVSGLAPEVVLGQAALESAWGKSVAGNNMFGIKGAGQNVVTHEDIPGVGMVRTTESFRAYNNPLDSFMDYGRLMDNARYGHIGTNQTVDQQIAAIGKSGYATDRNYGKKLGSVVDRIQASKAFQDKVINNAAAYTPVAEAFFGDIGIPIGQVDISPVPDLTPQPAPSAGFSLDGATLPEGLELDFSQYEATPDFSDITAGTAFDPLAGITPAAPATPDFSDVDVGSYPDITAGVFDAPTTEYSTPVETAPVSGLEAFGPSMSEMGQTGFAAGVDAGPWGQTPDFAAPSLDERNAMDRFENAMAVRNNTAPDLTNEALAAGVMAELSPQTPQAPIAPAPVSQAPAPTTSAPQTAWGGFASLGDLDPAGLGAAYGNYAARATQPQASSVPGLPSTSLPETAPLPPSRTQLDVSNTFDLPSFDLPSFDMPDIGLPSMRDIGSTIGLSDGFMDSVGGFMDSRTGQAITGAARGALTGGIPGAVMGGLWGGLGIGARLAAEFDRYANAYANLTPADFAAFGLDGDWTTREPTMNTGMTGGFDGRGGGRVGDGSYSEYSGRNDNNPQGIL